MQTQLPACPGPFNLTGLQTLQPAARSREVWGLIALAEALGASTDAAPLCPQERGALLYQVCTSPAGPTCMHACMTRLLYKASHACMGANDHLLLVCRVLVSTSAFAVLCACAPLPLCIQ